MPRATSQPSRTRSRKRKAGAATRRHRLQDRAIGALIWLMLRLPYRQRVAATGWIVTHLVAPLAGWRPRIRANLAHVFPDIPDAEVRRLSREVPRNFGRALIELFSPEGLRARACAAPITGPGLAAIEQAQAAGRPVIIATAHMGNYDVARAALIARGFPLGALYMPMTNPDFNRRYVAAMEAIGTPLFPRGREGLAGMLRHLRDGGMLALVTDHYIGHGEPLDFMGKPALTALSTAELALKYDALLVPGYCIRQPDGVNFRIEAEAPIEHGDPRTMTQALNDSVAAQVRTHMDQWLWMHRRWKKAKCAPA
jgi:Kdo2-lipid IVA lauroyltransferase/acyltransferase